MPFEKLGLTGLPSAATINPPENWGDLVNKYMLSGAQIQKSQTEDQAARQNMQLTGESRNYQNELAQMIQNDPSIANDPHKIRSLLIPAVLRQGRSDLAASMTNSAAMLDLRNNVLDENNRNKVGQRMEGKIKAGLGPGNYIDDLKTIHPGLTDDQAKQMDQNIGATAQKNWNLKLGQAGQYALAGSGDQTAKSGIDLKQNNQMDMLQQKDLDRKEIQDMIDKTKIGGIQLRINNPPPQQGRWTVLPPVVDAQGNTLMYEHDASTGETRPINGLPSGLIPSSVNQKNIANADKASKEMQGHPYYKALYGASTGADVSNDLMNSNDQGIKDLGSLMGIAGILKTGNVSARANQLSGLASQIKGNQDLGTRITNGVNSVLSGTTPDTLINDVQGAIQKTRQGLLQNYPAMRQSFINQYQSELGAHAADKVDNIFSPFAKEFYPSGSFNADPLSDPKALADSF